MKINKDKDLKFEDLAEGDTFHDGDDQVMIKTDEGSGCCLEDGALTRYADNNKVTRIDCEVKVL